MEGRLALALSVILLIKIAVGEAGIEPRSSKMDQLAKLAYPSCSSCLEASKRAEKVLNDPELFEDIEMLSGDVCSILPSELKVKCLEQSGAYIYQTKFSLKHIFHEANLCNRTRLCSYDTTKPTEESTLGSPEMDDEGTCTDCRRGVQHIFEGIQTPRLRRKIVEALIEYCEEEGEDERQCKNTVSKYAPRFLSGLGKLRPAELCRVIGLCDEGTKLFLN